LAIESSTTDWLFQEHDINVKLMWKK